jgi:hypothetical protein
VKTRAQVAKENAKQVNKAKSLLADAIEAASGFHAGKQDLDAAIKASRKATSRLLAARFNS